MAQKLKIVSWNVNGIRAMAKKGFNDIVKDINADILCIQETKAQDEDVKKIADEIPEYKLFVNSAEKKGYSGTAILSKIEAEKFSLGIGEEEHDTEGRVVTLEYKEFYLVNVYVPNSGAGLKRLDYRETWDKSFLNYLKKLDTVKPVIVTGDFNVAHQPIDLARPKPNYNKTAGYTQVEIDGITSIINASLVDTFRHFYPDKVQYTFWNMRFNGREKNIGWRIDYFLVSKRIIDKVKDSTIQDNIMGSDHCPIELTMEV